MKTFLLLAVAALGVAGAALWITRQPTSTDVAPAPAPLRVLVKGSAPSTEPPAESTPAPSVPTPPATAEAPKPDAAATLLVSTVDTLTSPQTTFGQKQALWNQLRASGQLAEVTAALERLAADNPQDAQVRTELGEAQLQKLRANIESGGDPTEIPILGMQADRYFSQALTLDPKNWEAQYMKAASLSRWPEGLNKRPEVIQRLSDLATQQDSMAPQPEFAQTYLILAQQYKLAGQPDKATETLRVGAIKFPGNTNFASALAAVGTP